MPEELWNEAASVALVAGPYATAKALHFNYNDLKKRMPQAQSPVRAPEAFVEVTLPTGEVDPAPWTMASRMFVDLFGQQGNRMRIEADPAALDLVGLVRAFCGGAP